MQLSSSIRAVTGGMTSVSLALDCKAVLGESPVCHPNGGVSFVDIYGKCVNHYDSVGGGHEVLNLPSVVCCIVPRAKGGLLAALDVRSYYPALYETVALFLLLDIFHRKL